MKDRNKNRPGYKKTKVGWIPLEWELKRLGDLGQINTGNTPKRSRADFFAESSVPWVKTMDLNNCIVSNTDAKHHITFDPSHTLILSTNRNPSASFDDDAFWDRVHVVPFNRSFVENPELEHERHRKPNMKKKFF